jgi:hypothetical protein
VIRAGGLLLLIAGCGAQAQAPVPLPAPPRPAPVAFADDPRPLPRYHSGRLGVSLPLPDGHAWRIDDHSQPELVATHAPTRSRVLVAIVRADDLVGRTQCEAIARDRKLVPSQLHELEQEVGVTHETFDTRTVLAVDPGAAPEQPLVGHVMAFGGFLRKCFVFDFSTEVDRVQDEPVLSARLAFARARILDGLQLDVLGAVKRQPPETPPPAP